MNHDRTLGYVAHIPIRWGDMDAMGHVNNTVYFRFMEQARICWFDRVLPRGEGRKSNGIVIVSASCHYRRPMTYPGTVEVKLFVGTPGASSIPTYYEMRVDDDPQPYATGEAVVVFIDVAKNKPVRVPEGLRARLKELMEVAQ
ncbi:MAG: thioesterase family protein [Burkholderiales bacterium]